MTLLKSKSRRWVLFPAALLLGVVVAVTPAMQALAKQQTDANVSQSGYYTKTQDPFGEAGQTIAQCPGLPEGERERCPGLDPSLITGGTPGYPRKDNYVYVAKVDGQPDAHGFALIDLDSLPFGAVILDIVFDFEIEDQADFGTTNFDPEASVLQACLVIGEWFGGDAGTWDSQPQFDGNVCSPATFLREEERNVADPETGAERPRQIVTMTSDLRPMAMAWSKDAPNYGIALVPGAAAPSEFQVAIRSPALGDPQAMVGRVTYEEGDDPFDLGEEEFGATASASFGGPFTAETGDPGGGFTVAPPEQPPVAVLPASDPRTPWWVWLIMPIGAAGIALLSKAATAEGGFPPTRRGAVSRLVQSRLPAGGVS